MAQLPSPLGESGGGGNGGPLGDYAIANIVVEIVPVRIVNSNAILVTVTNFPGQPPPLPGLRPEAQPPPLPGMAKRMMPLGEGTTGPNKSLSVIADAGKQLAGGKLTGAVASLASAAGTFAPAAIALAPVFAGFETFVAPLLGAAKGGFDTGLARGAGFAALSKGMEMLGMAIGLKMLPAVLEMAGAAGAFGDELNKNKRNLGDDLFGATFPALNIGMKAKGDRGFQSSALDSLGPLVGGFAKKKYGLDSKDLDRKEAQKTLDLANDMKNNMGPKASYQGVADVRQQAQLAALESPIERAFRDNLFKKLDEVIQIQREKLGRLDADGKGGTK